MHNVVQRAARPFLGQTHALSLAQWHATSLTAPVHSEAPSLPSSIFRVLGYFLVDHHTYSFIHSMECCCEETNQKETVSTSKESVKDQWPSGRGRSA